MATIANDNVIVRFVAEAKKFERDRKRILEDTRQQADRAAAQTTSRFSRIADVAGGVLTANLVQATIQGLGALGAKAIQLSQDYEQTAISFEVLTGSVSEATKLLEDLDRFSLETPFEPTQINNAAKTLLGFGRSAVQVKSDLELIGNASAATGADLENLAVVFGQVAGVNKLQGQDALQFINAGIPVYDLLAQSTGRSVVELKELQSQGKITFDVLREAFAQASEEGGKFEGALIKQSQTLGGLRSTLAGAFNSLLRNAGDVLLPIARELLPPVIEGLFRLVNGVKAVAAPVAGLLASAFRAFLKAAQPVVSAVTGLFERLSAGTGIVERLQGPLTFAARAFAAISRVVGPLITLIGGLFSELGKLKIVQDFANAFTVIPQVIGGVVRVVETFPTAVSDAFQRAKQTVTDFVEDIGDILSVDLFDVISGKTSFAQILADNEERRLAEEAEGTRQQFKSFGNSIADAYAAGYASIEDIKVTIPPADTPENKEAANAAGEEVGKEVGKGVKKGIKDELDPSSLGGLKAQLSELQKDLASIADPSSEGIDELVAKLQQIADVEAGIARVQNIIDRFNGDFKVEVTPELVEPDAYAAGIEALGNRINKALALTPDPEEEKERFAETAGVLLGQAKDLADQFLSIREDRINREIELQETRLSDILGIADQGNAEQLQLERERLQKLQSEREKAAQARRRIAAVEIAINNAVAASESVRAITAAFAEGNIPLGIATAASLALTVASTILTVSDAFSGLPSFRVGTENFDPRYDDGQGGSLAVLHRSERVLTAEQNAPLLKWGVKNADVPGLVGMALGRINAPAAVYAVDSGGNRLEQRLANMENLTRQLIGKVGRDPVNVIVDEMGVRRLNDRGARRVGRKRRLRGG